MRFCENQIITRMFPQHSTYFCCKNVCNLQTGREMTYFPIPGEGAWVLLREFCQKQRGKTLCKVIKKQLTHLQI